MPAFHRHPMLMRMHRRMPTESNGVIPVPGPMATERMQLSAVRTVSAMTEDDEDFTPWTAAGAERLRSAAAELSTALAAHAQAVTAVTGEAGSPQVLAANERLLPAVLAYADAQFDYTGNAFPFGVLHEYEEDDEDEEEDGEPLPADGISVLQRRDYAVTDEAAVMTAGRRAYLRVWPDDDEAAAAADVTHLGRAAYQLAHADGWESLDDVEGLEPTGGCVAVVHQDELLGPDPDEWPKNTFEVDGEVLHEQRDVFAG